MPTRLMFTGDVNLMNVTDAAAPFVRVTDVLQQADYLFGNLECCFYRPTAARAITDEGFYAAPEMVIALKQAGYDVVGTANNVNYGSEAILSSIAAIQSVGVKHAGSGANRAEARAAAIVEVQGKRIGIVQRTSVYWPTNHEAGEHSPGIAALRGHTAYHVPTHRLRPGMPPANRPGVPPEIITWADPKHLADYTAELRELRKSVDILIASQHWGLLDEVLAYMPEIAHAAVDAGADMVIGHGPHYSLPVEIYKGKPVFYGLGSFSFHTGHDGRKHGNWVGMMADVVMDGGSALEASFRLVRHNDDNETYFPDLATESEALAKLTKASATYGTTLAVDGDRVIVRAAK